MDSFFRQEGRIMQVLSTLADLVLLNLLTILCSLPIFTLGAAVTALYDSIGHLQQGDGGLFSGYFQAFRANFRQSALAWLVLLSILAAILYALMHLLSAGTSGSFVPVLLFLLAVWSMVLAWTFPIQAQFSPPAFHTLAYAFVCAIKFLPRTICMAALNVLPAALYLLLPKITVQFGFIWVLVYFSAAAYAVRKLIPDLSSVIPQ